jgi:hypothetical protein
MLVGGCGASLLPTTIAHVPLDPAEPFSDAELARLEDGATVAAEASGDANDWIVWLAPSGRLARVVRTTLGLEVQSMGRHHGAAVRPTVRMLLVGGVRFVVVESSTDDTSTERTAWLYAEHGSEIVPLELDGVPARLAVRAEHVTPLGGGWSRNTTVTATFEATHEGLVVHEHASVRELADGRPELPARASHEVERARVLRRERAVLSADRPSLLDVP